MSISIKPIGAEGAALLAALHTASFPANQSWNGPALALMLGMPGHLALIAVAGTRPEGFILARAQAPEAEILTLAVLPAARCKGIGRALLDALRKEAMARGVHEIFLEVAEGNAAAKALYAGAGAQEIGRRRRYYADGADALVLRISCQGVV